MSNQPSPVQIGSAQLTAQNVALRPDVILDEVRIEGAELRLTPAAGETPAQVSTGEVRFRVTVTEPNLNRALNANLPPDAAARQLSVELFSGKARISGQYVKLGLPIPFTLEATPRLENGIKVSLDVTGLKAVFGLPAAIVQAIELMLNREMTLDLSASPIPVYVEDVRCEPGRLIVVGRTRLTYPPSRPLSSSSAQPSLSPAPPTTELPISASPENG